VGTRIPFLVAGRAHKNRLDFQTTGGARPMRAVNGSQVPADDLHVSSQCMCAQGTFYAASLET
jgi:hypothetical protein